MARLQKDVVSYFPHDANACAGDTLIVLQNQFGNDGYAFWFKLLEKLASTDGHFIDCRNSTKWQLLLAKTGVNEITGVEIMKLLVEMDAIDKELWGSKLIWCQKLVDNIGEVYKNRRRETPQKPLITDKNRITTDNNAITTPLGTQSKESKVKRVKKSILLDSLFDIFWKAYPKKIAKGDAEKAFVKVNPDDKLLATMVATIDRAKKSVDWQKDNGKFIPNPATWLNGKRWEDEFTDTGVQNDTGKNRPRQLPDRENYETPEQYRNAHRAGGN